MKRLLITLLLLLAVRWSAFATWSIIVLDEKTREVGIAGASCTSDCSGIGSILPGRGAIIVQAMSNYNAHDMGRKAVGAGYPLEEIMGGLREARFDPEHQQYALVTFQHMTPLTYTGDSTLAYRGALTGYGISVQGNLLSHPHELQAVFDAAMKARKRHRSVRETLLLALEAGARAGGDRRCGEQRAQSAFLQVAQPADPAEKPSLSLVVRTLESGQRNAVAVLRENFEAWQKRR